MISSHVYNCVDTNTAKNTLILPNFLVWKFCGKAQFPHSFWQLARNYAETVPFHKISTTGNQVKLLYFSQWNLFRTNSELIIHREHCCGQFAHIRTLHYISTLLYISSSLLRVCIFLDILFQGCNLISKIVQNIPNSLNVLSKTMTTDHDSHSIQMVKVVLDFIQALLPTKPRLLYSFVYILNKSMSCGWKRPPILSKKLFYEFA